MSLVRVLLFLLRAAGEDPAERDAEAYLAGFRDGEQKAWDAWADVNRKPGRRRL